MVSNCFTRGGTSMRPLGPRFSVWVAIQSDHCLQTTGLYRFVRHPSYTGAIFTLFGNAIIPRSYVVGRDGTILFQSLGYSANAFDRMKSAIETELKKTGVK